MYNRFDRYCFDALILIRQFNSWCFIQIHFDSHVAERYSSQLLNARVFLISQERCKAPHIYGTVLDESMFCAGTLQGGIDSCQVCRM